MATVYLHIGAPKTATSNLQSLLAANYQYLLKQGVLYPKLLRHGDAHHTLVADLIQIYQGHSMADLWYGDQTRGEAWQDLRREIEQHTGIEKIILSSELFFGQTRRLEDMLADIRGRLQGFEIKVIVYLRRQDQLYSSFFNQDVKGARQWAQNAYEFFETHQIFQQGYDELLDVWGNAVGPENMLIRPYEPVQWLGGNIAEDFSALVGIDPLKEKLLAPNSSLGPTQLYIKQCLNRVGYDKGENESVLAALTDIWPEEPMPLCTYVHKGLYRRYRRKWLSANKRLSDRYLNGKTFFQDPIPPPEKVNEYRLDRTLLQSSVNALYDFFSRRADHRHRSLFARAMLLMLSECDLWDAFDARRADTLLQWL
ncbi:MAG: hypothetical protein AAF699_01695 [Pseudomonadota bacterium]